MVQVQRKLVDHLAVVLLYLSGPRLFGCYFPLSFGQDPLCLEWKDSLQKGSAI